MLLHVSNVYVCICIHIYILLEVGDNTWFVRLSSVER